MQLDGNILRFFTSASTVLGSTDSQNSLKHRPLKDFFFIAKKKNMILGSVFVIVLVYSLLFLSIRRTRHATPLAPNEIEIAIRFFFIVFTDCLCWMPTIILKILALSKIYIPGLIKASIGQPCLAHSGNFSVCFSSWI